MDLVHFAVIRPAFVRGAGRSLRTAPAPARTVSPLSPIYRRKFPPGLKQNPAYAGGVPHPLSPTLITLKSFKSEDTVNLHRPNTWGCCTP